MLEYNEAYQLLLQQAKDDWMYSSDVRIICFNMASSDSISHAMGSDYMLIQNRPKLGMYTLSLFVVIRKVCIYI